MKKLALVAVLTGLSLSLYGQGKVNINTLQTGSYLRFFNTVTAGYPADPTQTSWHVQLYWGASATPGNMTSAGGTAGFANSPAGMVLGSSGGGERQILDGGTPVTSAIYVQLRAWSGAATYELAAGTPGAYVSVLSGPGAAPVVVVTPSQSALNSASPIAWGGSSASPLIANIELVPVPEPSTIAMVGLGLLGLLFIRRRK